MDLCSNNMFNGHVVPERYSEEYAMLSDIVSTGWPSPSIKVVPLYATDRCKYKTGMCRNPRAVKLDGRSHTLCEMHRKSHNLNQRKSDRKKRAELKTLRRRNMEKILDSASIDIYAPIPYESSPTFQESLAVLGTGETCVASPGETTTNTEEDFKSDFLMLMRHLSPVPVKRSESRDVTHGQVVPLEKVTVAFKFDASAYQSLDFKFDLL